MKNKKILVFALLILAASIVSAIGVSYPHPQNIELLPGQSSYFTFQIQSDDTALVCVPIVESAGGLELAFNQKYEIDANQKYIVKPQVIVPEQTPLGQAKATFCVECTPLTQAEGSKVIPKICNLPITANIVSARTGKNMFDEEKPKALLNIWITLLTIAVVILAIIIYYLVRRRKRASA